MGDNVELGHSPKRDDSMEPKIVTVPIRIPDDKDGGIPKWYECEIALTPELLEAIKVPAQQVDYTKKKLQLCLELINKMCVTNIDPQDRNAKISLNWPEDKEYDKKSVFLKDCWLTHPEDIQKFYGAMELLNELEERGK